MKRGTPKEKEKCLEVIVLSDEMKYGVDQPNKTELRVISKLRGVLFHPELAYTVKYVRSLFPLGSASFVIKAALLFTSHILMGWGFYALDVGTDVQFSISMFTMNLTNNSDLANVEGFAYLKTVGSYPILAVENSDQFIYAGFISVAHVGISIIVSMVLFISTECGKFSRDSLYRLPIPFITKTREFSLELEKLKLFKEKRDDKRNKEIKKMDIKIQKHSNWINLSLMVEASFEASFQFLFQSVLALPATLGLFKQNLGSLDVDALLTQQNFSILASFVSFAMACVSIRYLFITLEFDYVMSYFLNTFHI